MTTTSQFPVGSDAWRHKSFYPRQVASPSIRDELNSKPRLVKPMRRDKALHVETLVDDASVGLHDGGASLFLKGTR